MNLFLLVGCKKIKKTLKCENNMLNLRQLRKIIVCACCVPKLNCGCGGKWQDACLNSGYKII